MLQGLIPEYNSIRITKAKGLPVVIFKKDWWKFWTRYTVNITDVCISEIPKRLDEMAQDKNLGNYRAFFNNIIFDIVAYKENPHTKYTDIIDYLWEYYEKIYYHGGTTILPLSNVKVIVQSNYLPVPFAKVVYSFSINSIIKEIPSYFKTMFQTIKEQKVSLPKDTPISIVRHIYLIVSDKLKFNFGYKLALN